MKEEMNIFIGMQAKKSLLAMFFAGLMFMAAAALICFLGKDTAWYIVAAAFIAGGVSQFAFQDPSRRAQKFSVITAYIATACLIGALVAAICGY